MNCGFDKHFYLDLLLETDNKGNLSSKIYDKRDDLIFLCAAIFHYCRHVESLCHSSYAIVEHVVITKTFYTDVSY